MKLILGLLACKAILNFLVEFAMVLKMHWQQFRIQGRCVEVTQDWFCMSKNIVVKHIRICCWEILYKMNSSVQKN